MWIVPGRARIRLAVRPRQTGFKVPLNTLWVILGRVLWSNDPTNSANALKEVVVISLNPTRSTSPCYNSTTHNRKHKIHKNESKHSEMDPVRQNSIQGLLICSRNCATTIMLHITLLHNWKVLLIVPLTPDQHKLISLTLMWPRMSRG